VVEPGEPEWLPEDRDIVETFLFFEKSRNSCGHWYWQAEDVEGLEPGYRACPLCAEMVPYRDSIYEQNRERERDLHGLTFGWFPPRP